MAEPRHAATPARRVAPGRRPLPPSVLVIAVTGVSAVLAAAVGVDWTVTPRFELFGGAPTGPASPWLAPDAEDLPPPDVVPLTWTGPAILGVLAVLGLVLVVVLVRWLWRIRPRRRVQVVASAADQESGPASYAERAAALHRATKTALELLEETPEPRDAVIRTWLALEQAAATSGAARRPADTPTEFTRGLLVETSVDPDAVTRLLDLYHRARFSAHRVGPVEVGQARDCVLRLSRSLTGYESALRRTVADPRP